MNNLHIKWWGTLLLGVLGIQSLIAQSVITGTVVDKTSQETLIGVNVILNETSGTSTDLDGNYTLSLPAGSHKLVFQYTGYSEQTLKVEADGSSPISLNINLSTTNSVLDVIVISGSRFERKATEETVTIDVITPEIINRNNNTSLSDVVKRVPGVEVVDGQANIRSGSGYAYGAGSRVALLVDEQPLLSAELSDVKWNFVPIENAQQIEIIKGAASVLYGSSALNGVIHVRSAWPTAKPFTSVSLYAGLYNAPRSKFRKWWSTVGESPYQFGTYFAHRRKVTPNFDLVLGGNVHYLQSYLKGSDERRFRINCNTRFRPEKNDRLTLGINGNFMYHEIGNFFLWLNGQDSAFVHIDPTYTLDNYSTVTLDPWLTYFDKFENKHTFKSRYFNITKWRGVGNENSPANIASLEYQFQRTFKNDWVFSTGSLFQYFNVRSVLFQADSLGGFSVQSGFTNALYAQVDKRFFDKLNTTIGLRWENFRIKEENIAALPVLRLGLNYELNKTTFLRASYGQGYRVPSLGERYIEENLGQSVKILANPDLRPEKGWSTEIGLKKAIDGKRWNGYVDAAFFWMEYKDMTEFYFDFHKPDSVAPSLEALTKYLGFKSTNVSHARVAGLEFSFFGEGRVGNLPLRVWAGYTYSFPGDISADSTQKNIGVYLGNFFQGLGKVNDELAPKILKYRSLHTTRLNLETDVKGITFGVNASYNSYVHNIDAILDGKDQFSALVEGQVQGIADIKQFREEHNTGDFILDLQLGYKLKDKHQFTVIAQNLLNREYMLRAGKMSAPRSFNLQYRVVF